MKILIVHQYYLLPGRPGGSRFNEMARLWREAGHQVSVIAGTIDYQSGARPEKYRQRWITKERDAQVTVWRAHVPAAFTKGYTGRMWAFFGFALSSVGAALLAGRPDVVVATSPPLTTAITGWFASRCHWCRVPWIFEIRDLWPESAVTTGVLRENGTLTKLLYRLERWACRRANLVNVLTPAFRDSIVERGLAPAQKVRFVPNAADVEMFSPGERDNGIRAQFGWGDRFVVMYAGAHGRANALDQLVEAAELLRDWPDIMIASVGDGPERRALEAAAARRGLANIKFHGAQPKELMPVIVRACDVGAAILQNNLTFRTVYPNKVFDYMACERPTLLAIDGVARKLVCDEARAGVFVEPENPAALANAIRRLRDDPAGRTAMGKRGRQWVLANATREAMAERYLQIILELVHAG